MNRHDRTLKRVREMNTNFFPFLSRADGGQDIKMRTAPLYDAVNGSAITCRL